MSPRAVALLGGGVVAAICVVVLGGTDGAVVLGLGLVLGASMLLDVHIPTGGTVPVGHAVVIALGFSLDSAAFAGVAAIALYGLVLDLEVRRGAHTGAVDVVRTALALAATGVVAAATAPAAGDRSDPEGWWLGPILAIGCTYLLVDVFVSGRQQVRRRICWRNAVPVYVSLLCSGTLLAMAPRPMLLFAALPLFITRYSFERYAVARRTYQQTIQALGIVPELAGHVRLGHGERTAFYASVLAEDLGLSPEEVGHVTTAARLHHVGHVSVPDCVDTQPQVEDGLVASAGAAILRDSGFLPEIAELVEAMAAPDAAGDDLKTAIVRTASAFDELVGEDAGRARGALAILASKAEGTTWTQVVDALRARCDDDGTVAAAIAAGAPLTMAAAEAEEQVA